VIVDLARFVAKEEPHWRRLEAMLEQRRRDPWSTLSLEDVRELDYLYRRTSADLVRVTTFSTEPGMRHRLEQIVARAYAEIHGVRGSGTVRIQPWRWLTTVLPRTVRRQSPAVLLALLVTLAGMLFGGVAVAVDPEAKQVIMPFSHLLGEPGERVAEEEAATADRLAGHRAGFAGQLMTHNTQVALFALALGMTWGVGTVILVFYNGVILGAVVMDYVLAGQTPFLLGWLLPHGVVEIPAILLGAQGGFVLARALLGRENGVPLGLRLRAVTDDVATIAAGAALMLVWAGVIESYFSQYHEPAIPYALKIAFGVAEAGLLVLFFGFAGRTVERSEEAAND
jgi:uncharacterized membrane protein SpoIIM required for sporulation